MWRYVPPAGTPVSAREILGAFTGAFTSNGASLGVLEEVSSRSGVRRVFAFGSGRAALWAILRALARLHPGRDTVAIPAYTCYSVPAAVVRAGLKVHPVEMNPATWDFDYTALEAVPGDRLLAILSAHLFGLVADVPRARAIAAAKGAYLIDDAAQALGARLGDRWAGTMGDVGLFSLGRGKALGAAEGGLAVTDSEEIAREIGVEFEALPPAGLVHSAALAGQMLAGAALLHPSLYRIPQSLPFLKLGETMFDPRFPLRRFSGLARGLFGQLFSRLEALSDARRRNAAQLEAALAGNGAFSLPVTLSGSSPVFIRFPVLARDAQLRERALDALHAAGIGASGYYPAAVCDIEELAGRPDPPTHCPRAEDLSRRLLTLPSHPFVGPEDISRMGEILFRTAEDAR
jgi:dTDP-4-amino-4,6-dideoxygalactose transaminase